MTKPFLITTLICMTCAWQMKAQSSNSLSARETTRIDSIINKLIKKYNTVGASIAIVDNKQMVFAKGYGFADRKNKIAANENTAYCIGSITKTFTAMAIMKLREEGKIDLEKSAEYYLPELKMKSMVESGDVLKIKNLLTHTSGLTDGIMNNDMCTENKSVWTIIDDLNQQVLVQPADWKMNYSNLAFDLLGCIVERVSGMKYEEYIKEKILDKVQMPNTTFAHVSAIVNAAKGYLKDTVETPEPILRDMPAGRLVSDVVDMSKFMTMIMNNGKGIGGEVVSAASMKDMESDHLANTLLNCDSRFGYGMFIERMYNAEDSITGYGVGHAGDTYVFHATMFVFPKTGVGFVILTNSAYGHSFCNSALVKLYNEYMQQVKGIKLHPDTTLKFSMKALRSNIADQHELSGIYRTGGDDVVKVKTRGKRKVIFR